MRPEDDITVAEMLGIDLRLSANYPGATAWRVYRDGDEVGIVTARGPLSALVFIGRSMPSYEHCNGEWEVQRVT